MWIHRDFIYIRNTWNQHVHPGSAFGNDRVANEVRNQRVIRTSPVWIKQAELVVGGFMKFEGSLESVVKFEGSLKKANYCKCKITQTLHVCHICLHWGGLRVNVGIYGIHGVYG